jgi:hypothetical protein
MRDRNLTEIQIKKNLRASMHDRKFGAISKNSEKKAKNIFAKMVNFDDDKNYSIN